MKMSGCAGRLKHKAPRLSRPQIEQMIREAPWEGPWLARIPGEEEIRDLAEQLVLPAKCKFMS